MREEEERFNLMQSERKSTRGWWTVHKGLNHEKTVRLRQGLNDCCMDKLIALSICSN